MHQRSTASASAARASLPTFLLRCQPGSAAKAGGDCLLLRHPIDALGAVLFCFVICIKEAQPPPALLAPRCLHSCCGASLAVQQRLEGTACYCGTRLTHLALCFFAL